MLPRMMPRPTLLASFMLALTLAAPARAGDRTYVIPNFDRVRVDGSLQVRVTVGGVMTARAAAQGDDRMIDTVNVSVMGNTLVVRRDNNRWGEQGTPSGGAPVVVVAVPMLRGGVVNGGGRLSIDGQVRAQRLDLQVTGAGTIDARGADADELNATLIGAGGITVAGSARRARLMTNGTGTLDAGALVANDLIVRLDGPGETRANARYTADVTSTGLGPVSVAGDAKCVKHAQAGAPIACAADGGGQ